MKNYNIFLSIVATIIIALAVGGVLIISYHYLTIPTSEIKTIKIEYNTKIDSKNPDIKKLDSLLNQIKITSNKIQQKQLDLIEDKSDENFFNKLYTAIVAIIFAIAGFFGFKSINEIKFQVLEDAKDEATKIAKEESIKKAKVEARKVAKEEFKKMFNEEYEAKIFDKSIEAMNNFLAHQISELDIRIFALEEKFPTDDNNEEDFEENNGETTIAIQGENILNDEESNNRIETENLGTQNPFD